jgi:hypothetical protein
MAHDIDPKQEILAEVGPHLDGIVPLGAYIVAAAYIRPEKTKGGVLLSDYQGGARDEDKYQGKVHLLLKCGPLAFYEEEAGNIWGSRKPAVGDWIIIKVSDGMPFLLGKRTCRLVFHEAIRMIVNRPDVLL